MTSRCCIWSVSTYNVASSLYNTSGGNPEVKHENVRDFHYPNRDFHFLCILIGSCTWNYQQCFCRWLSKLSTFKRKSQGWLKSQSGCYFQMQTRSPPVTLKLISIPVQLTPSPLYLDWHIHVLLPAVFVQVACEWQPPLFTAHSLTSA